MNQAELTNAFWNVQRVQDNRGFFPPDLTKTEKDDLWILVSALLESEFAGDAYDILRDAFEHERLWVARGIGQTKGGEHGRRGSSCSG